MTKATRPAMICLIKDLCNTNMFPSSFHIYFAVWTSDILLWPKLWPPNITDLCFPSMHWFFLSRSVHIASVATEIAMGLQPNLPLQDCQNARVHDTQIWGLRGQIILSLKFFLHSFYYLAWAYLVILCIWATVLFISIKGLWTSILLVNTP